MCNFLSAIVLQTGEIVCDPEHTDSHDDLIDSRGLADNGRGGFIRVEFLPGDNIADPDGYSLILDAINKPEWWTENEANRVAEHLRDRIRRMIVTDSRKILLGGCWIVCKKAVVTKALSCRIISVCDSATIERVYGSATIGDVGGSATIGDVGGSATIERVYGSATIRCVGGSATIRGVYDSATIERVGGSATIKKDRRITR